MELEGPNVPELRPLTLPLGPQDIFAYLVPGATILILIFLYETWCRTALRGAGLTTPVYTAFITAPAAENNWAFMLLYVLAIITLAYVLGHLIGWISVLFIDRILVHKGHGYPHEVMLRLEKPSTPAGSTSSYAYRALFFWLNVLVVVWTILLLTRKPTGAELLRHPLIIVLGIVWLVLLVGKIALTQFLVKKKPIQTKRFWYWAFAPYNLITVFLGKYTRTTEPFTLQFTRAYNYHFESEFGMEPQKAGTANYWWTDLYVRHRAPALYVEINYWHRLYSFSRNISTAFYLGFWYSVLLLSTQTASLPQVPRDRVVVGIPVFAMLVAALLFLARYYYFYASRHTRLLLRTFVYLRGGMGWPDDRNDEASSAGTSSAGT